MFSKTKERNERSIKRILCNLESANQEKKKTEELALLLEPHFPDEIKSIFNDASVGDEKISANYKNQHEMKKLSSLFNFKTRKWRSNEYLSTTTVAGVVINIIWQYHVACQRKCGVILKGNKDLLKKALCHECQREVNAKKKREKQIAAGCVHAGGSSHHSGNLDVYLRRYNQKWFACAEYSGDGDEEEQRWVAGIAPGPNWEADCSGKQNKLYNKDELKTAPRCMWENAPWADRYDEKEDDGDE